MKFNKFQLNYKCNCYLPGNICSCSERVLSTETHIERVKTVAAALVDVSALDIIHQDG